MPNTNTEKGSDRRSNDRVTSPEHKTLQVEDPNTTEAGESSLKEIHTLLMGVQATATKLLQTRLPSN